MLTRHGWGALLLAITTAVIGRLFGVLELFVLGTGIFTLVVVTLVWINARRCDLTVRRHVVPDLLQVGEVGRVELLITNQGRASTAPLQLWEPVSGMGGASLRMAPLHAGESTTAKYRLPAERRGTITFGPLTVERRDPFGLCVRRQTVTGTHEAIVLPAHAQLALPSANGGSGPLGRHLRMRSLGRDGSEFHALREYADGDDLRQIHWRASARSETLKVREVEPEGLRRCTVALDVAATQYSPESFERAVSTAAGAVSAAGRANLKLRLVAGDEIDLRNTNALTALFALADCSTVDAIAPSPLSAPGGEGLGLYILVTGSPRSAAAEVARRQLGPRDVLVVVACTTLDHGAEQFVVDGTNDATLIASWATMTGVRAPRDTRVAS